MNDLFSNFKVLYLILIIISFPACTNLAPEPTITSTSTQAITLTTELTSTKTPTISPTFTPPSVAQSILPDSWSMYEFLVGDAFNQDLDQYKSMWQSIRENNSDDGIQTGFGPIKQTEMINGKLIHAEEIKKDGNYEIAIIHDNDTILSITCSSEKSTYWEYIIAFWTFDNHWVLEYYCEGVKDIILDGQSLNETNGYSDSFSPHLISGNLFFFFYKNNNVGFYYNDNDYLLDIDEIHYHYCCGIADYNPTFHDGWVSFNGIRGGEGEKFYEYNYRVSIFMGVIQLGE
jgi:hypothetical protein